MLHEDRDESLSISLIEEHAKTADDSEQSRQAKVHYENTLAHIKVKQQSEQGERYADILTGGQAPLES